MDTDCGVYISAKSDSYNSFQSLLVVDDHLDFLAMIGDLITGSHPNTLVVTCSHPKKAITLFDMLFFDILLSDMNMPGYRGDEFIRLVRRASPMTHILAITAGGTDFVIRAGHAGVQPEDFFEKNCNTIALEKRIKILLAEVSPKQNGILNRIHSANLNSYKRKQRMDESLGLSERNYEIFRKRINAIALLEMRLPSINKSELAFLAGYSTYQKMCDSLPGFLF